MSLNSNREMYKLQTASPTKPDATRELDTNPERSGSGEGVGVRGLQEGRDYFTWPTVDKEKTLRDLDEWLKGNE